MATHSSILAWRIPWTEEPGRLQSMASQSRTRLNDLAHMHAYMDGASSVVLLSVSLETELKPTAV